MKKNVFFISGTVIVSALLFMFASCSSDDDFLMGNGLDINSQVPLTRSGDGGTGAEQSTKKYEDFEHEDDECLLVSLVRKIIEKLKKNNVEITAQNGGQAQYNRLKERAKQIDIEKGNTKNPYSGGQMPHDIYLDLGKEEGILSGVVETDYQEYLNENTPVSIEVLEYNKEKKRHESHVGNVKYVKRKKDKNTGKYVAKEVYYESDKWPTTRSVEISKILNMWE